MFLRGHFLFTYSDRHFCCRMYRLPRIHSITDRRTYRETDRQTDRQMTLIYQ